jgi:hypothetical protein
MTAIRTLRIPTAIASIHLFLGIQEEHHEGQVVVEFKEVQIQIVDPRQPDPHELVRDVLEVLQTDNLPVKFMASRSRHAANDNHEGLAADARQGFAFLEIENPAVGSSRLVTAPGLSRQSGGRQFRNPKGQAKDAQNHEQSPSARSES